MAIEFETCELFPSSRFYHQDLADPPLELETLPDGMPGMRALEELPEPNPDRHRKLTLQSCVIE